MRFLHHLFLPILLLLAGPLVAQSDPSVALVNRSVREILNADGTIRPGTPGRFAAPGYRLSAGPQGQPVLRPAGPSDAQWREGFDLGAPDQVVTVITVAPNGDIYVGGSFQYVGDVAASCVARWDGTRWWPLGEGVTWGREGVVTAIAFLGNDVVVAGRFNLAGGQSAENIARWDGAAWHPLGAGLGGYTSNGSPAYINTLAVVGTDLYAGGSFYQSGSITVSAVARWNGTTWSALGAGITYGSSGGTGYVFELLAAGNNLYVAGRFTHAAGVATENIARWDGAQWHGLGQGIYSFWGVRALAMLGNDLYAGGFFTQAGNVTVANVARWNGTAWAAVGAGTPHIVGQLTVAGNSLYAIQQSTAYTNNAVPNPVIRWDGTTWTSVGPPLQVAPTALLVRGAELYMGTFDYAKWRSGFVHYDGTRWQPLNTGLTGDVYALARVGTDMVAGGAFSCRQVGAAPARYLARWDGAAWQALPGELNGAVRALVVAGTNLYVGGDFSQIGSLAANHVARWDGVAWHTLGTGTDSAVYALAVAGSTVYAGGKFAYAGGVAAPRLARWDGAAWGAVGGSVTQSVRWDHVDAILVDGPTIYVGGSFGKMGGVPARSLAQWNGLRWDSVGGFSPYITRVTALAKRRGNLYVGTVEGPLPSAQIGGLRRWDGTTWTEILMAPDGYDAFIFAMDTTSTGDLLVAGRFTSIGVDSVPAKNIARLDNNGWHPLGTGTNDIVYALQTEGQQVVAGGRFCASGDGSRVMGYFGIYDLASVSGVPADRAAPGRLALWPNPAAGQVRLGVSGGTTAVVFDGAGREVRRVPLGFDATLDVRDLPPGLYLVRVGSATARLVRE